MEQLFKERKEKLYLFKSLRKKRQQKRKTDGIKNEKRKYKKEKQYKRNN